MKAANGTIILLRQERECSIAHPAGSYLERTLITCFCFLLVLCTKHTSEPCWKEGLLGKILASGASPNRPSLLHTHLFSLVISCSSSLTEPMHFFFFSHWQTEKLFWLRQMARRILNSLYSMLFIITALWLSKLLISLFLKTNSASTKRWQLFTSMNIYTHVCVNRVGRGNGDYKLRKSVWNIGDLCFDVPPWNSIVSDSL